MHQPVEEGTEGRPPAEDGPLTEQQLGLRQAEERLYRDYIHRLLKVRKQSSHAKCIESQRTGGSRSFVSVICMFVRFIQSMLTTAEGGDWTSK